MSEDKIQQYILAAGKDKAIQDVGLYEHPQQVYMLGATIGVCAVLADWIESDKVKDARIENLQAKHIEAINLMGAAIVERIYAVEVLKKARTWLADGENSDAAEFYPDYASPAYKQVIQDVDSAIAATDAEIEHNAEFERIQTGHRRYEALRRLNTRQFADLYAESIKSGVAFDDLVDGLARGDQS